jgi:hypothetical protein
MCKDEDTDGRYIAKTLVEKGMDTNVNVGENGHIKVAE